MFLSLHFTEQVSPRGRLTTMLTGGTATLYRSFPSRGFPLQREVSPPVTTLPLMDIPLTSETVVVSDMGAGTTCTAWRLQLSQWSTGGLLKNSKTAPAGNSDQDADCFPMGR